MKKLFTLFVASALIITTFSQVPEKMSYQAVVRNTSGELVKSTNVGMQISILQGSESGIAVYVETHTKTTNVNGLVTIEIGSGTPVTGTFAGINWSTGVYFIKTETDPTGGTTYTITGTSQLLSVPYALYAKTSESSNDAVKITGNQTISGNKTFSGITTVITPVNANDAANKAYVDALIEQLYAQGALRVRDYDGNYYNTIKIGTQIWMTENLKTTRYRNGDLIGTTTPATLDLSSETTPKFQWAYDGNEFNVSVYGRLYTWYAVTDSRNVCPTGWHVPTYAEWTTLTDYLTNNGYGYEGSGGDIAKSMAATYGWTTNETAGNVGNDQASNNSSGFTALPSGLRWSFGPFNYGGIYVGWWSSTDHLSTPNTAYLRTMSFDFSGVSGGYFGSRGGLAVRCLQD